jgi:hypothetical protein
MPIVSCEQCTHKFYAKPSHLTRGWGKYCSKTCQYTALKTGVITKCDFCGKEVYKSKKDQSRSASGKFFCGKSCQTNWRNTVMYTGDQHANWTNGESSYRQRLLRARRPQICTKCLSIDSRILAVHHIDKNRQNNKMSNLTWLCHNCHYLVHHYKSEAVGFIK